MPRYVCRKCNHEFWGWGVSYQLRSNGKLVCPDCHGRLVLMKEKKEKPRIDLIEENSAA